jgi:hypothetical protein
LFYYLYLNIQLSWRELFDVLIDSFPVSITLRIEEPESLLLASDGFRCIADKDWGKTEFIKEEYGINYRYGIFLEGLPDYEGDMLYELYLFIGRVLKSVDGEAFLIAHGELPRIGRNRYETVLLPVKRNGPDVSLAFDELGIPFRKITNWEPDFFKR